MVKHIIIWSLKEDLSGKDKTEAKKKVKEGLEGLLNKIEGLVEIKVNTEPLTSSSGDMMLDSTFVDEDALLAYQSNPEHIRVASYVRSVVSVRRSFDFTV